MNCKIGEIIFRLREEAGLSQGQLCHGLCSVPQMARMEQDQVTMDYFLLDRFFWTSWKINGTSGICIDSRSL